MTVTRLKVEKIPAAEERERINAINVQIQATFSAIARILAVRFLLLLSVVGSFVLGVVAINNNDTHSLFTLGIFGLVTMLPLALLELKKG